MKKVTVIFMILFLASSIQATKLAEFPKLNNPVQIAVLQNRLYISEKAVLYIYSMKDFTLIKSFGGEGEGPGEFKRYAAIEIHDGKLFINSVGKISIYKKDGTMEKEVRAKGDVRMFRPVGDSFIGQGFRIALEMKKKINYKTLDLYDSSLNRKKEVFRQVLDWQQGKGTALYHLSFAYRTFKDKIYVAGKHDFEIQVFNSDGKYEKSITLAYKKVKFTEEHREKTFEFFRLRRRNVEEWKKIARFPDKFPAIRSVEVNDQGIYVQTYRKTEKGYELFIFDLDGKLVNATHIALKDKYFMIPFPHRFVKGRGYQISENEETEIIELHEIKL